MRGLSGKPLPHEAWEVIAASLLVAWRIWAYRVDFVVRDWFSILCVFWIFTALGSRTRAWPVAAGLLMTGLLLWYGGNHLPLAWTALGFRR